MSEGNINNLDYVYENYVGALGLWQIVIVIIACLSTPSTTMIPLFVNSYPKVRCNMGLELEQYFVQQNFTFDEINKLVSDDPTGCTSKNISDVSSILQETNSSSHFSCLNGYEYEDLNNLYPGSLTKEWDIVCENKNLLPLGTNIYMFGSLVGLMLSGDLGDRFGRKKTVIFLGLLEMLCGFLQAFSPDYIFYILMRAIIGGCGMGKMMVFMLISVETTNSKYRSTLVACWSVLQFFLSRAVLSLEAYLLPYWRYLVAVHSIPTLLVFLYFPLIPESPRWLLCKDKLEKAVKIIKTGKRFNSIFKSPDTLMSEEEMQICMQQYGNEERKRSTISETKPSMQSLRNSCHNFMSTLTSICHTKELVILSVISIVIHSCQVFIYYGLMYLGTELKESIYLICFFNALMCLPATVIVALVYKVFSSRKRPLLFNYSLCAIVLSIGTAYTIVAHPDTDIILNVCVNICLVFLQASLNMLYIYTAELYPSEIRSRGAGYASGLGRFIGSFCVFMNPSDKYIHGLPFAVYCGIMLVQIIFLLLLSDTDGKNLQDKA